MSTTIRKATKYYPLILENKGPSEFGRLCAVRIVALEEKCNSPGED